MNGRPLRFLGLVLSGWVGLRTLFLWPDAVLTPPHATTFAPLGAHLSPPVQPRLPHAFATAVSPALVPARLGSPQVVSAPVSHPAPAALSLVATAPPTTPEPRVVAPQIPPSLPPTPLAHAPSRLAGSFWAVARGGAGDREAARLGGSQAGARLTYALDDARRLALATRLSTPLEGRGVEAALGLEWRPFPAPVRLIAEQRLPLDGGRGGTTLLAVAGLPPTRVGPLTAEAYGQAGVVLRRPAAGFADGAARLSRRQQAGALGLDFGLGAWAGVQPGAARVDIGPTIGINVSAAGRTLRLTADWRARVAGDARPGSGPAVSIGTDF